MPAADAPEQPPIAGFGPTLVMRFGLVGLSATAIYAVLASVLMSREWIGLSAVRSSVAAYAVAALFSYFAHKTVTFMSRGRHRMEAPRFLLLTATGLAVAYCAPALLTGMLGLPGIVPVLVTCIAIPVLNLVVLGRWVFARRTSGR
jgi:putative flippase GtrA